MTAPPESISKSKLQDQVKDFLSQFKDKSGTYKYVDEIDQMMAKKTQYIVVDYNDLVSYPEIESVFTIDPDEILRAFGGAIKDVLKERFPQYAEKIRHDIRVRISNYPSQRSLREVNAEVIGKVISVSGMVVRSSEIKPLAKELVYFCPDNHKTVRIQEKGLEFKEPLKCDNGKCTHRDLEISPEQSKFIDFQMVRLQELPEDLPPGQLPHYLDVTVLQDLVDNARPGDRIILTGIVRIEQEHIPSMRGKSGIYRLRVQGNNIEFHRGRGNKTSRSTEREEISPDEERIIKSLVKNPDIYDRLISSFAPHVSGHDIIKEAILLLIVGSTQKILSDGAKIRGDINVFLVGDPGCLDASSKVILGDGRIVDLVSLGKNHLDEIRVRMQNEDGTDVATVFHKYENQKVIEIITETGKRLVGTYNHPLLTRDGWKRFDELREGIELRTITNIPCSVTKYVPTNFQIVTRTPYFGKFPEFVTEELAGLMGFMTGDGWVRNNGYRMGYVVSQKEEEELLPSLLQMGHSLFGMEPKITKKGHAGQVVVMNDGRQVTRTMYVLDVVYDSKNITEMFGFLKGSSRNRTVPSSIFQSPDSVVSSYLKWLFEADGAVFNKGRASRAVQLKSASIQLLRDVQLLLLRFGIHSRIIQHHAGSNLVIRRGPSIVKYAKHIGFASNTKAEKLNSLVKWALEIRRDQRHDEEYEKISQINYLKEPQVVYDVEIPKSHKFIANGIVSHNTAKSEMLKFCARIAPRGLYTSGRGSTAAGLTAAVVRDKIGIMMLEAGAVVLGDQGLVCMTEDTEIYTGSALIPIGKMWDGINGPTYITKSGREAKKDLIPVNIYDGNARADIDGNAFAIMRKRYTGDVIKITFSSGLTLKVTPEHLLRRTTHVKSLWMQAQNVKPGQLLRAPVRVQRPACMLDMTEQDSYVIGCIYGDGYITNKNITISQSKVNSDVIHNIQKNSDVFSLYDKGDRVRTLGKYALVSRMYQLYTADKTFLQKTRFLTKSPSIDNILLLSDKSLWAFLAGVFDTDGDFNHAHGKVVAARMYPSMSLHELGVMLYALRRFGICAKIRTTNKGFPLIQITGRDVSRFAEGIKSYSVKSQREVVEITHKGTNERGTEKVVNVERVPYDGYVYDLSVGKYHNYEASLVYIHNCIDEFDKMKPEDRSALHETMEQQSVSIAKGGIVATLNARTSILAAANPMFGKYDPFKNITENVNLPVPLLTRFDLIFVVRDIPSKEKDTRIARHILNLHRVSTPDTKSLIDVDILTKYLSYAKKYDPNLTPEAEDLILDYYMTMRNVESEGMITVTPRQLEGLVRLATARARLLMKTQVDGEDAERAIFLMQSMLQDAGVDVNTGKVDLGVLQGRPHSEVSKMQLFMDVMRSLEGDEKRPVEEKTFVKELVKTGKFTEDDARKYLKKLQRESAIYESKPGHYNRV